MRMQGKYIGTDYGNLKMFETYAFDLRVNWLGGLQRWPLFRHQNSLSLCLCWLSSDTCHYKTITDWRYDWSVKSGDVNSIKIPVPWLHRVIGAGDAFEMVAEALPLWIKSRFNGCADRKYLWNLCVRFVPWSLR